MCPVDKMIYLINSVAVNMAYVSKSCITNCIITWHTVKLAATTSYEDGVCEAGKTTKGKVKQQNSISGSAASTLTFF